MDYKLKLLQQIEEAGLPLPDKREFQFMFSRNWKFDYLYTKQMVAIEYHGGIAAAAKGKKSGHINIKGFDRDHHKLNEATIRGYRVIVVNAKMVREGLAVDYIKRALENNKYDNYYLDMHSIGLCVSDSISSDEKDRQISSAPRKKGKRK